MREDELPALVLDHVVQAVYDELEADLGHAPDPDDLETVLAEVLALLTPQAIERLEAKLKLRWGKP